MSIFNEQEIDYSFIVSVKRPGTTISDSGDYEESFEMIIENMKADIQLSLKIRRLLSETSSGSTDNTVWIMFCNPPLLIREGDRVFDGTRTFIIDAVGEWGSHVECFMRKI